MDEQRKIFLLSTFLPGRASITIRIVLLKLFNKYLFEVDENGFSIQDRRNFAFGHLEVKG